MVEGKRDRHKHLKSQKFLVPHPTCQKSVVSAISPSPCFLLSPFIETQIPSLFFIFPSEVENISPPGRGWQTLGCGFKSGPQAPVQFCPLLPVSIAWVSWRSPSQEDPSGHTENMLFWTCFSSGLDCSPSVTICNPWSVPSTSPHADPKPL